MRVKDQSAKAASRAIGTLSSGAMATEPTAAKEPDLGPTGWKTTGGIG
jgi:hypothetical protein